MNYAELGLRVLEAISYLCAVGVLIVAIKGLSHIKIAKNSLSLTSKRDALKVADSKIASFFELVLPHYEAHKHTSQEAELIKTFMVDENGKTDFKSINKKHKDKLEKYDLKSKADRLKYEYEMYMIFNKRRESFNKLEAFAAAFTSGLASEKSAYFALGKVYCNIVQDYQALMQHFNAKGYYKNTLILYRLWNKRLAKDDIEQEVSIMEARVNKADREIAKEKAKLRNIKQEISAIEDEEIISIGTE